MTGHRPKRIPLLYRVIILRIILMTAIATFFINIFSLGDFEGAWGFLKWFQLISPPLILIHHILRLWSKRWWSTTRELLVSSLEIFAGASPFFVALLMTRETGSLTPQLALFWSPLLIMAVSCLFSFAFLLCDILQVAHPRNYTSSPYDFSAGLCIPGHQWSFIFGSFTMRRRFRCLSSTDNRAIRGIRGGFAILILLGMLCLVFYASIWQPLQWSNRPGVKMFKKPVVESLIKTLATTLSGDWANHDGWPFQAVLLVSDLQSSDHTVATQLPMMNMSVTLFGLRESLRPLAAQQCNYTQTLGSTVMSCLLPFPPNSTAQFLDIFVTVDFSQVQGNLRLYLASSLETEIATDIVAAAEPIGVSPGLRLYGWSSFRVIERFANQNAAILGISKYRSLAIINLRGVSPDWQPRLTPDNNTGTIRIRVQPQQEIDIEQEYLEGSVLNGFALVGGIWTFISGAFAAIFGTTLLLVLLGIKPLSIYGLLHYFRPGKGSLVDGGSTLSTVERDHILGVLKEHLLDKDELERVKDSLSPGSPAGALPQSSHSQGDAEAQI